MRKAALYYHTLKNLKPSQALNRLRIKLGAGCPLGVLPPESATDVQKIESPEALDFDPAFLARFPVEELMENKISILHSSREFDWKSRWEFDDRSALWNFNLHYFEYLFPLVKAWRDTGNQQYLDKTAEMIEGWIDCNPAGTRPAWASYPTALRIATWISYFGYAGEALERRLRVKLLASLHDQYRYLAGHLEKDILGNHYLEDLKSLVLASIFFKDEAVLNAALPVFKAECREQILPDGMHFELSPMYHKLVLEGMLRAAAALRGAGRQDAEIESYLQPMLNAAYSLEHGLERIPLFNDGGNNVAKSLYALTVTAERRFALTPRFTGRLESSGFYILEKQTASHSWRLIVDAGQPGPRYIPGHAHCDAMSFELFRDGTPIVVNCGTYAYQCGERGFFRSTAAHNTVMADGMEQSQCWGAFRLAKRSSTSVLEATDRSVKMEMTDQAGKKVHRSIVLSDVLTVIDTAEGERLSAFVHLAAPLDIRHNAAEREYLQTYAADYGQKIPIAVKELTGIGKIELVICLEN